MTEPVAIPVQEPYTSAEPANDDSEAVLAIKIVSLFVVPAIGFGGV